MKITIYLLSFLLALSCVFTWHLDDIADDPGVGWHLKTGEYVAEHGTAPVTDPFLARELPLPWVSDQWLGDYFLFRIFQLFSWSGLYTFCVLLFFLPYYGVLQVTAYRFLRGSFAQHAVPSRLILASLITAMASYFCSKLGLVHLIIRPVLFGYAFFAIEFAILFRFYILLTRRDDQTAALQYLRKNLFWLPLLFVLWANVHPSFVVGLFLLALLTAAVVVDKFLLKFRYSSRISNVLVILGALCTAVTLINPYGLLLHESIFSLARSDYFMSLNSEWKSLGFRHLEGTLFEILFGTIVVAIFIVRREKLPWRTFEFALFFCFAHFSLQSVRMLPYFALSVLPLFAESMHVLLQVILRHSPLDDQEEKVVLSYKRSTRTTFVLVCCILFFLSLSNNAVGWYAGPYGPRKTKFPYDALAFLNEQAGEKRVYATPNWGGFLTFYGKNGTRALIDDRNTMLGEEVYKDYFEVEKLSPRSEKILTSLRATHLLLYKESALARKYRQDKEIAFEGDTSVVIKLIRDAL